MTDRKTESISSLVEKGFDFEVSASPSSSAQAVLDIASMLDLNKSQVPWKAMVEFGWISSVEDVDTLVAKLSSSDLLHPASHALFKKHETAEEFLVDLWVTKVAQSATQAFYSNPDVRFDRDAVDRKFLTNLARTSVNPESIVDLPRLLFENGIILVIERGLPGIKADGVVYTNSFGLPVIGLALRYARYDHFWFTLLHELSHVMLHYDRLAEPIIDLVDMDSADIIEIQANRSAKDSIVPRYLWERCDPKFNPVDDSVRQFSDEIGVHPALVAGLLRHELDNWKIFTDIIDSVDVREVFGK